MTVDEARDIVKQAVREVDWLNFARALDMMGPKGFKWRKFDNGFWRPAWNKIESDKEWIAENAGKLKEALDTLIEDK